MGFGAAAFTRFASEGWWACLDSNQEPDRYERPALTIELQARAASRWRHATVPIPLTMNPWRPAMAAIGDTAEALRGVVPRTPQRHKRVYARLRRAMALAKRCAAELGPYQRAVFVTVPVLRSSTSCCIAPGTRLCSSLPGLTRQSILFARVFSKNDGYA